MGNASGIIKINKKNCSIQCFFVHFSNVQKRLNREHVYEKKSVFYGWVAVGSCSAAVRLWDTGAGEGTSGARTADRVDIGILGKMFVDAACVYSIYEYTGQ